MKLINVIKGKGRVSFIGGVTIAQSADDLREFDAPGIPDGQHLAYLQAQYNPESISGGWKDESEEEYKWSVCQGIETRKIWKLSEQSLAEKLYDENKAKGLRDYDEYYNLGLKKGIEIALKNQRP